MYITAFASISSNRNRGSFDSEKLLWKRKSWALSIRPEFCGNSDSKSNGTEIFRKFVSKILVHLSIRPKFPEIPLQNRIEQKVYRNSFRKFRSTFWGCPFFWKFPVPFGISTRCESALVLLVLKSFKMAASISSRHYTKCKMICHCSSLFVIVYSPQKR